MSLKYDIWSPIETISEDDFYDLWWIFISGLWSVLSALQRHKLNLTSIVRNWMQFGIASNAFFAPLVFALVKWIWHAHSTTTIYIFFFWYLLSTLLKALELNVVCMEPGKPIENWKIEKHKKSFGELELHSSCATIYKIHTRMVLRFSVSRTNKNRKKKI